MILLWDFHDTSCKFIRKVSFLYITIYQVNTTLFSLKMRLWDFLQQKKYARKWYYSRSCDCFRMKYKERGWGLQIPGGKWSNIFWQRIANPLERLTGDFLIENQPERLAEEWNTNKEDGDCKSPGGSGRTFFDSGLQIRWNAWRETFWLRISQSAWRKTFWLYAEPITQNQKEPFFDLNQLLLRFNQNNWNLFLVFIYFLYLCPRIPIKKGRIPIKEDKTTYKTCNLNNV